MYACLGDLHREVTAHRLQSPTLLIIGEVVALSGGWLTAQQSGCSLVLPKLVSTCIPLTELKEWPIGETQARQRSGDFDEVMQRIR